MNLEHFLSMGGYGLYVWTSYGIVLIALAVNVLLPLARHRRQLLDIARKARQRGQDA
jgi:heme exporter protein D